MLNDTSTVSDESLFAATIILRVMEEMDGKLSRCNVATLALNFYQRLSWIPKATFLEYRFSLAPGIRTLCRAA